MSPTYRLVAPAAPSGAPALDEDQQRVVDHVGGPLLVLAGPGTGKTTTLVEAIVDRIVVRGADPSGVLALTFSRKAAEQLCDRVSVRLGRTTSTTLCSTFHSFAYALIRRYAPAELYVAPLRLLSAPEQDVVLRELLAEHPEAVRWPDAFRAALGTRGFAREVHDVLARAREKGLDGRELHSFGIEHGVPELAAAGLFLEQYLTNLDSQGATDYADLIRRAVIEAEVHRDELRAEFSHVFVDEYQDTDPAQVALLRAIAGDGRNLTVVGDPHQSIYGFRGADVRGILEFPTAFARSDGAPADVVRLRTTRRFGPHLLATTQRIAARLPASPGGAGPEVEAVGVPGRADVLTFDTERAEAEHLADLLRRAHLEDGIAWSDMAVLVRSARTQVPALRRALGAAGVPVDVAGDDIPLVQDPAVAPLLEGVRAVLNLANDDENDVDYLDAGRAEALLMGPLCGLDAGSVRRLARQLRARERDAGSSRPSRDLLRAAVVDRGFLDDVDGAEAERARRLHRLLAGVADTLQGASGEDVLWALWSGCSWGERLLRQSETGGASGRNAGRDLDAIVALFDMAARAEERRGHAGVRNFLASLVAQQLPADTLAERGVRGEAVRLLTAHRSKGLEWRLVAVAHVQAEAWPDLRRRSTLLQADRIGTTSLVPPPTARELLAEERRLFYVACTRAKERLVVTAVRSSDDDGEQPSRFLDELGRDVVHRTGRPPRPLSVVGLVAELRRTAADPSAPEELRGAAAVRLAHLAAETGPSGRRLVPEADPDTWWGLRGWSLAADPLRDPGEPVRISASMLKSVSECPAHWFLERDAGGSRPSGQAASLGKLVHKVAELMARDDLEGEGRPLSTASEIESALAELMQEMTAVWDRLEFRTPWSRTRELDRLGLSLRRFLQWRATNLRKLVDVEVHFSQDVDLGDGVVVRLNGFADRLEIDRDGRMVVVDFKTGRGKPTGPQVAGDLQLALYQLAVDEGALGEFASGGAELVQLGSLDATQSVVVQAQAAPAPDGPERRALRAQLADVAQMVRAEEFPATPGTHCRYCDFFALCPAKGAESVIRQ